METNAKIIGKFFLVMILLAIAIPSAFSASCVALSLGGTDNIVTTTGTTNYVSIRLYNTSSGGSVCETGTYDLKLELKNESGLGIDDYFDYSFSENKIVLNDNETKRVLLTITPKYYGDYNVIITVSRENPKQSGSTNIVSTASMISKFIVRGENSVLPKTPTDVKPAWASKKQCTDGSSVDLNADCPVPIVLANSDNNNSELILTAVNTNTDSNTIVPIVGASNPFDDYGIPILVVLVIAIFGVIIFYPRKSVVKKENLLRVENK